MEKLIKVLFAILIIGFFLLNHSFQFIEDIKFIIANNFILFLVALVVIVYILKQNGKF
jgi:hypothetical protein